jgi:hypothetical protein
LCAFRRHATNDAISITWRVLPYALLTFGEVLVSATGLEFAYNQAPAPMKGAIMARPPSSVKYLRQVLRSGAEYDLRAFFGPLATNATTSL